jgi:HTH-type transcriptional regulator/antitoxin MqsA
MKMEIREMCPVCGEGALEARHDHVYAFLVGRQKQVVEGLEHSVCSVCGTSLCSPEQTDRNVAKIEAYQNALPDYISPENIAALRARYNISQSVAATIFGGGPNAFSKYERGEVCPSAAAATLMVLSLKSKDFFEALARAKGVHVAQDFEHQGEISKARAIGVRRHSEHRCFAAQFGRVAEPVVVVLGTLNQNAAAKFYVKGEMIRRERDYVVRKRPKRPHGAIALSEQRYVGQTGFDKAPEKKWNAIFH